MSEPPDRHMRVTETCTAILNAMERDFGEQGIFDLLVAMDRHMNWYTEIIATRSEVEQMMMEIHGAFDADLWVKVQDTEAWKRLMRRLYDISRRHLVLAIEEIVYSELSGNEP